MSEPATATITVALSGSAPDRSYEVLIGEGLLARLGDLVRRAIPREPAVARAFLVVDSGLPLDTVQSVYGSLVAREMRFLADGFTPSERVKTLDTAAKLLKGLTRWNAERGEPVLAVGGGIVGDVAGFVAATYRRGVPLIQCPTTLLAMVDAAVGGKTGVNTDAGKAGSPDLRKNMVGVFHQPRLVVADVGVLRSLPARQLSAGLAECIKHGMIARSVPAQDHALGEFTRDSIPAARALDMPALQALVLRNVALKASVVQADEREEAPDDRGGRALLNLGHTFAHAFETLRGLALPDGTPFELLHGEAVGLGLLAAARTAKLLGLCDSTIEANTRAQLAAAGLPERVRGLPPNPTILAAMAQDKKTHAGRIRLILPTGPGTAGVFAGPPSEAIAAGLDAIRATVA